MNTGLSGRSNAEDKNEINESGKYFFIIHGFAPEFMTGFAFRIERTGARRVKEIKCPYCGRLFETVDAATKVEVHCKPQKTNVFCHTYRKCRICHGEVGIKFA